MSLEVPEFHTELEEADWWYEHREEVEAEFVIAAAEGRLTRRDGGDDRPVPPIEVDAVDLNRAKDLLAPNDRRAANSLSRNDELRHAS